MLQHRGKALDLEKRPGLAFQRYTGMSTVHILPARPGPLKEPSLPSLDASELHPLPVTSQLGQPPEPSTFPGDLCRVAYPDGNEEHAVESHARFSLLIGSRISQTIL